MYLDQLYELVRWNGFDSLAHLTYPLRYINGEHHFGVELKNYAEKVDEILKLLAKIKGAWKSTPPATDRPTESLFPISKS